MQEAAPTFEFWFHHAGVSVVDMDAQIDWYGRMLGFQVDRRFYNDGIPAEVAILRNGPLHFELFRPANPILKSDDRTIPAQDVHTTGNKHVAFSCPDVRGLIAALEARGVDLVWLREYRPGVPVAYIRDPEGNLIEFVQYERMPQTAGVIALD